MARVGEPFTGEDVLDTGLGLAGPSRAIDMRPGVGGGGAYGSIEASHLGREARHRNAGSLHEESRCGVGSQIQYDKRQGA